MRIICTRKLQLIAHQIMVSSSDWSKFDRKIGLAETQSSTYSCQSQNLWLFRTQFPPNTKRLRNNITMPIDNAHWIFFQTESMIFEHENREV